MKGGAEIISFLLPQKPGTDWKVREIEAQGGRAFEVSGGKTVDLVIIPAAGAWVWTRTIEGEVRSETDFDMCGINGIAFSSRSGRVVSREVLEAMRDVITHRGPDDEGIFIDRNVGLGHRRLSIVDVASGHQPMTNEDASLHITYNGEIYNHADYRESLEANGHVYHTHCDTETILHLYEEHGSACVDYLRGMFAFAIWDQRKRELFIARDRLGVKPLYYVHTDDGSLYFGSEIKTLLEARRG